MRQIQYKLPNVILTEIPERQLRKDTDVKVRIAYAAVCGSDIHEMCIRDSKRIDERIKIKG